MATKLQIKLKCSENNFSIVLQNNWQCLSEKKKYWIQTFHFIIPIFHNLEKFLDPKKTPNFEAFNRLKLVLNSRCTRLKGPLSVCNVSKGEH
jgi:hypothetical protein